MNAINVVGIGLDGAAGLTKTAQDIIDQATLLMGSRRHLSYFGDRQIPQICLVELQQDLDSINQYLTPDSCIVILVSGDPLFFGLGRLLLAKFSAEQLRFYPHVSSIQLAFSRLKIPWQDASLISLHGREPDELIKLLKQGKEKIATLTDSNNHPGAIARLYLALDLPVSYDFYICENLGDISEKLTYFSESQIIELAALPATNFASLNVLILLQTAKIDNLDLASLPLFGLNDRTFLSFSDRPGLITKKEIRLAILGELALQPQQIVWDIGAGTGSVSIEIARLCPNSQIFAVEKTSMGSSLITKNCQRLQVENVEVVCGKAPEVLLNLPKPHRIFIGGSGGNLEAILDFCTQKLAANGIMVMAFATVEHCHQAVAWLSKNSWQYRLLQLQISRSTPVNNLTRFTPLNPVTIITTSDRRLNRSINN